MRRAEILTGGVVALILLAMVCIPGDLSFLLRPTAVASTTFHSNFELGNLAFRLWETSKSLQSNHRIKLLM
jgi:hypothetical protein